MTDFYGQYLLVCGWWRQSDDGPVRWDGPQRYGGRGKDEDPCQREEESSADGLDEEVRAVQQLLRRSLARTWTRAHELFAAPRGGRVLHGRRSSFSFAFECEERKKGFFSALKVASDRLTLAPKHWLTAEDIRLYCWEQIHPHTFAFILITFSTHLFILWGTISHISGGVLFFYENIYICK